jgi:hypothetical protein
MGRYMKVNTGGRLPSQVATLWASMASVVNIVSATIGTIVPRRAPDATFARCKATWAEQARRWDVAAIGSLPWGCSLARRLGVYSWWGRGARGWP